MSDRLTNLGLATLLTLGVITGFGAFSIGTPKGRWVVVLHGLIGLAVVAVSPWKTVIARRGLARPRSGRWISLGLSSLAFVTLASGVTLITGLLEKLGPLTIMQIHVGAGLLTLVTTLVHLWQRPVRPKKTDLSRRAALRATGTVGLAGIFYLGAEGLLRATGLPGKDRRFTGSHEIGSKAPPPTSWLNDSTPAVDSLSHAVQLPSRRLTAVEIDDFGDEISAVLDCTGGWHSKNTWTGARIGRLLGDQDGESIVVRSVTGYWRRFPLVEADRLWLATRVDGTLLRPGNGSPVRLVAPSRRGFWWVKWVDRVEVDDKPPWWQPPLPLA